MVHFNATALLKIKNLEKSTLLYKTYLVFILENLFSVCLKY